MDQERLAQLREGRRDRVAHLTRLIKGDLRERLAETKTLFGRPVLAVDIHSHSSYSDGRGTVEENYEYAKHLGLDFFFATDHGSTGQKRHVKKWADASWGQEPGAGPHHLGLLCGSRLFKPRGPDIAATVARAKTIAPFVWIPHPVGWYPCTWYSDEQVQTLWTLGPEFAVEVMNGANKVVRAYDAFDAKAVTVWDRLLCDGRKVTAVAASDAHCPEEIGSTWTGVFAAKCTAASIIQALNAGLCFGSEAALLDLSCNGRPIGSTLNVKPGVKLALAFRAADSAGLTSVRIVSQGRTVKEIHAKGKPLVDGVWTTKAKSKERYYRLESTSADDRRAFSTPVYVEVKQ